MKRMLALVSLILATFSGIAANEYAVAAELDSSPIIAGRHYIELPTRQSANQLAFEDLDQASINVYFYPESLASYQLNIALNDLVTQNPSLQINKIPYVHNQHWRKYAKIYYIAKSLGIEQQLLTELYTAIHELGLTFNGAQDFIDQLPVLSPYHEQVLAGFTSPLVNQQIRQQQKILQDLPVKGVPSIILNNRWLIDASMAQSTNHLMSIVRQLLQDSL